MVHPRGCYPLPMMNILLSIVVSSSFALPQAVVVSGQKRSPTEDLRPYQKLDSKAVEALIRDSQDMLDKVDLQYSMEDKEGMVQAVYNRAYGLMWWYYAHPSDPMGPNAAHHVSSLLGRIALFDKDLSEASRLLQNALSRDVTPGSEWLDWKLPKEFLQEVKGRMIGLEPGSREYRWYESYRVIFCTWYVDSAVEKGLLDAGKASRMKAEVMAGKVPF